MRFRHHKLDFYARIKRMWRMRALIKKFIYFNKFLRDGGVKNLTMSDWNKTDLHRKNLEDFLISVHFLEDFRDFFLRKVKPFRQEREVIYVNKKILEKQVKRHRDHRTRIKQTIEACLQRKYLEYSRFHDTPINGGAVPLTTYVRVSQKGVEFIRWLRFFNAFFENNEYGRLVSFAFGVIGTGIFSVLYVNHWVIWDGLTTLLSLIF